MTAAAIDAFWAWWATNSAAFAAAFDGRRGPDAALAEALSARVAGIDPGLDWEFGPGKQSRHHLCLSGKGDPVLRVTTERWVKRGPAADATWEYYASRQPTAQTGLRLEIAGQAVDLDQFTFAVSENESRELLDLKAHHPVFERIADERLRRQILFIAIDNLLGEDGTERWLGGIDESRIPLSPAVPYAELRDRVDELARRATRDRWAVLKGTRDGKPVFITTNLALKRIDHLLYDMHLAVAIRLLSPNEHGLTHKEEGDALNAFEDGLVAALGADGVLVGHETVDGHRTIYLRVMEGGPARGIVDAEVARLGAGRVTITPRHDPRWDAVRGWR